MNRKSFYLAIYRAICVRVSKGKTNTSKFFSFDIKAIIAKLCRMIIIEFLKQVLTYGKEYLCQRTMFIFIKRLTM